MALKKLLNKGTVYKRSDNRWGGMVSYHDEQGVYRRKNFCAPTKKAVLKKIGDYIEFFKMEIAEADETKKPLRKSMQKWLEVFQYGTVEIRQKRGLRQALYLPENRRYDHIGDHIRGLEWDLDANDE